MEQEVQQSGDPLKDAIARMRSKEAGTSGDPLKDAIAKMRGEQPAPAVPEPPPFLKAPSAPMASPSTSVAGSSPAGSGAGQPLAPSTGQVVPSAVPSAPLSQAGSPLDNIQPPPPGKYALPTGQEEQAVDAERGVTRAAIPKDKKFTASDVSEAAIGTERTEAMYAKHLKDVFGMEPKKGQSSKETYRELTSYYDDQVAGLDAQGLDQFKARTELAIKGVNDLASEWKQDADALEQAARSFEQEVSTLHPEQANAQTRLFNAEAERQAGLLEDRRKNIESLEFAMVRDLQMAALRDYDIKKETGSGLGVAVLVGPTGVGRMASGLTSFIIDGMTMLMPAEFVGPEVASGEMTRDQAAKEIKRLMLDDIRKGGAEMTRKALGLGTTEEYYQDAAANGPFMAKAMIGLGESLPAMATPFMSGIFFQTADAVGQELEGEQFDDILEVEKTGLKIAFGLPAMALERFGFRNLAKNTAVTKAILTRVLGVLPTNATAGQIQRVVDAETRSYLANFGVRMAGAVAAEAETGGAQTAVDIGTREFYNAMKGRNILETPETLIDAAYQIAEGAALEAAGAGAMGLPVALRAALRTGKVTKAMTDRQYQMLEGLLSDEDYAGTVAKYHDELVKTGKMTAEQKVKAEEDLRVATDLSAQIPADLPASKRKEAFDLLLEKQALSGKDKNLVKGKIIAIDEKLAALAGAKEDAAPSAAPKEKPKATPDTPAQVAIDVDAISIAINDIAASVEEGKKYGVLADDGSVVDEDQTLDALDVDYGRIRGLSEKGRLTADALSRTSWGRSLSSNDLGRIANTLNNRPELVDKVFEGVSNRLAGVKPETSAEGESKPAPTATQAAPQTSGAQGQVTPTAEPTAEGPVSPVDGEMTVKSFAESIASGNRLDTPEAVQFYKNNKKEIEAELQRMAGPQKQAPQQTPVDPNDDAEVTLDEEVVDDPDALLDEAMGKPLTEEEIDSEIAEVTKAIAGTDTEVVEVDQDGLAKAVEDNGGDVSSSMAEGFFIGKDKDGKRRIYVSRETYRRGLMAHEGTHALLFASISDNKNAKKVIANSAKQALGVSPEAKKVLLKFLENYGGAKTKADGSVDVDATVADPELGEEVMAEFVAALYNGTIKLDNAMRQFIRDLYNRVMAALGVSTKVEFKEDGDFIAAAKQIASAMKAGRKIKASGPAEAIAGQLFNEGDIKLSLQGVLSGKKKVPKFSALDDIASWIAEHAKKNPVVKPGLDLMTSEGRAEAVRSIVKHTMLELDAWSSVKKDYKSFYGDDIQKHTNPLISQYVEMKYGRKPTKDEISLIHLLSAFGSGQSTPTVDTQHGLSVFDEYMKTGKVTGYTDNPVQRYKAFEPGKPPQPVFIDSKTGEMTPVKKGNKPMMREDRGGQVSKTYNVSGLRRFMDIYEAFGRDLHKTMSWLGSKHSFAEIERVIGPEAAKNLSPHEYLDKNSQTFGVFSLGDNPKLGSYILNRWSHFGTITKDMWVARTMSRYFNEPNTGVPWKLTKVDLNKRKILDEAWGIVAKKRGVEPANVQEMMWDAEKSIYARLGQATDASYTSTGVAEAMSKLQREDSKIKFSKKAPATQGDFKKGKIKDLLDKKDWVIMTAENPNAEKMSDAENASRMKSLMADLDAMGAKYTPVDGKYGNEEKSLAITGVTEKQAIELGKKYGQESVLTNKGLVYQDGSYNPATGASELDTKPDDFYSVVNGQVFQIDIDFDQKIQPLKFSMGERRLKDKVEQTSGDVKFFQSGSDYFFSTADGFFKGIPEAGGKRISRQDYDKALSQERIKQLERGEVVRDMGNRSESVVASNSDKPARSWMDKMVASDNAVMMKSTETASIQTLREVADEFGLSVDPNKAIKPALMSAVRREINRRKVSGEANKIKFSKATPGKNRVPQEHRDNLTDDGKGNYVFFHKGPKKLKGGKVDPSYFGTGKTKDNRSNPVMNYYTKPDHGERMISGDVTYAVPVPKWKVYPLMSDPLDLYDKAEANFRKKFGKDQAFDAVRQADFIGPLAEKAGFDMMIAGWSVHPLRAESGKALKPDMALTKKYEEDSVVDLTAPGAYERMMAKARGDVKFSSASPENIAKALIAKGYNTKAKAREYMVSKGADRMVDQVMAEFDKLRDAAAKKAVPPTQQKPDGDGVKKTFAGRRVYDGAFRDEVREEVRKLGLFREVESRAEAREKAKKLIETVGIDAAVDAVRNKDMEGGAAAFVWDEALRQLDNEILESTDPTTHQELVAKQAEMVQEIGDMQLAAGRFNSAWGDILKNSDLGYHSEKKAKEWEDKFGERPSKEIMDEWRKRDEELAELKKKLDAAEKRAEEAQAKSAIEAIAEAVTRDNERTKSGRYSGRAKRMADEFRKLKTKPIVILDADGKPINITKLGSALPFDWNELIEVGAKAIEKTGQLADAVTAMAEKLNKQKWFASLDSRNKMAVMSQLEDAVKGASEGFGNERIKVPVAMIRNAVAAGIRDIDMLVNVIKEQIKDQYPDASDREIRDAITGYGKVVNMSKDEISVAIRRMKDIGRVVSALEDIDKKIRPMRSGLQRDKLDADQRALHNKLRDAMKDLPVDQAENDRALKTALEAAKTRARNRIEDLQREIDTKERAERKRSGIVPDSELAALIKERDMLKEEHERVFGPRVVTEEMRVKSALDSIRRSIEEYERRIAANELDAKKQAPALETPELKIARENLGKLRDDYKKLQDEAGVVDRRRTDAAKKATKSRIAELERRIADQDFSKKPVRKTIADDELTTLRAEKERIKEQYDSDFYKEMMRNRTTGQRVGDAAWEAWGVLRAVQSTLDLSFVLLQGGVMTISNMWRRPDVVASAFKNMFASMGSEKKSEEWLRKVKAQPWYAQAKEAKLAITQPHAQLTNREELFMSDWTRIAWSIVGLPLMLKSKAAHDRWVRLNPFRALERGASAYLDVLRVERYLEGVKMLEARKADINGKEVTTQDYKDVADVVNTLTGRASLGAMEQFSSGLTKLFYSPRMWASAIKTGTPYGLYHFGKMTPTARKMAILDMGRFFGTTMGFVTLAAIALADDDDDETYVETDPRSADFGKIRIGDIRVDPWGGRVQQAVATTRLALGGISLFMDEPIDAYKRGDKTMPLGKGFGTPTMFDVGLTMALNKLSPSASFITEAARTTIGKDGKRYSMYDKDPYVLKDEFNERLMPLYVGTVVELMQDDPGALEGFLSFYSLFGASVSMYGQKPKSKAKPSGTTQGPSRVPKRPE